MRRHASTRGRASGATRLPIDRAFTMKGFGTVVTGTLVSGRCGRTTSWRCVPGRPARARARRAGAWQAARRARSPGSGRRSISAASTSAEIDARADARRARHADADAPRRCRARSAAVGEATQARRARALSSGHRRGAGPRVDCRSQATAIAPGSHAAIRLRLEAPAALTRGDRFILRAYSPTVTIGGGQVLDPDPPRAGVRTEAAARRDSRRWRYRRPTRSIRASAR